MPLFRCLVRGENFLLRLGGGRPKLYGLYTTRWVDAADAESAEIAAYAVLRKDQTLMDIPASQKNEVAKIYIEEIEEEKGRWVKKPGKGFTFFPMDEADADD